MACLGHIEFSFLHILGAMLGKCVHVSCQLRPWKKALLFSQGTIFKVSALTITRHRLCQDDFLELFSTLRCTHTGVGVTVQTST